MKLIDQANADIRATSSHERFSVMDGLRGIAALAVVLLHSFQGGGFVPNAQLAVDFFFILSGFVIAYSYEPKLAKSMSRQEFMVSRFIRLYPMVFIGALGGVVIALIHNKTSAIGKYPLDSLFTAGGLSLVLLPYFGWGIPSKQIFAFNPPIWSLFFEIAANIVYISLWRVLSKPVLAVLTIAGVLGVVYLGPLDGGSKLGFIGGVPRVTAGFFGGILLFRLWRDGQLPKLKGNIFILGAVLAAVFCLPIGIGGILYLPTFVILWFVVLAAANAEKAKSDRFSEFLGDISYPVYLIHWLTLYVFTFVLGKVGLKGELYYGVAIVHLIAIPFIGFAVGHFYEKPVRQFLKRMLLGGRRAAPQPAGQAV